MTEPRNKVFISWSGELSRAVAVILKQALEDALQHVDAFISESDIAKGDRGHEQIMSQLADCCCGIIVLTAENVTNPWVLFEAGAIAGNKDRKRAMPLLVDLTIKDLAGGPLNTLQGTRLEAKDIERLATSVNESTSPPIPTDRFERRAKKLWTEIEQPLKDAIAAHGKSGAKTLPQPSATEGLLDDILRGVRNTQSILERLALRADPPLGSGTSPKESTPEAAAAQLADVLRPLYGLAVALNPEFRKRRPIEQVDFLLGSGDLSSNKATNEVKTEAIRILYYQTQPRFGADAGTSETSAHKQRK